MGTQQNLKAIHVKSKIQLRETRIYLIGWIEKLQKSQLSLDSKGIFATWKFQEIEKEMDSQESQLLSC